MSESTAPISGNKILLLRNMLYRYSAIYKIVNTPAVPAQDEFCAKSVFSMHIVCPPGRRKRGRPKATWAEGIRGLMGEKGLIEEDWKGRNKWKKQIR